MGVIIALHLNHRTSGYTNTAKTTGRFFFLCKPISYFIFIAFRDGSEEIALIIITVSIMPMTMIRQKKQC